MNQNEQCNIRSGETIDIFRNSLKRQVSESFPTISLTRNLNCFIKYIDEFIFINPSKYLESNWIQIKIQGIYMKMLQKILKHYQDESLGLISIMKRPSTRLVWGILGSLDNSSRNLHRNINTRVLSKEMKIDHLQRFQNIIIKYLNDIVYLNPITKKLSNELIQSIQVETLHIITQIQNTN